MRKQRPRKIKQLPNIVQLIRAQPVFVPAKPMFGTTHLCHQRDIQWPAYVYTHLLSHVKFYDSLTFHCACCAQYIELDSVYIG